MFIFDNNSKFGTLSKLKSALPVIPILNKLQIQVERTVFEVILNNFDRKTVVLIY